MRPIEGRPPGAGNELQIEFGEAAPNIEGHVEKGSQPAAGAQIVLVPEQRFRSRPDRFFVAFADANGDFELTRPAPGRYTAYAFEQLEPGAYFAFAYNSSLDLRFINRGLTVTAG
jgi:hypothetical protein